MFSGIYQIRNIKNDKTYIGSAINFQKRWSNHKSKLNKQKHHNKHLQNAWNLYGCDNFVFEILEEVSDNLIEREQYYLDNFCPYYNLCHQAHSVAGLHWKLELETKNKIREANLGDKNPQSKLSRQQVEEIRAKYIPRIYSLSKLGKEYNVTGQTISLIVNNKRWKDF